MLSRREWLESQGTSTELAQRLLLLPSSAARPALPSALLVIHNFKLTLFLNSLMLVGSFGLGAFFSLMSTSFQYEDPMNRANVHVSTMAQTKIAMKDMGVKMLSSGKGFAKVGAIYAGVECCVEGVSSRLGWSPFLSPFPFLPLGFVVAR